MKRYPVWQCLRFTEQTEQSFNNQTPKRSAIVHAIYPSISIGFHIFRIFLRCSFLLWAFLAPQASSIIGWSFQEVRASIAKGRQASCPGPVFHAVPKILTIRFTSDQNVWGFLQFVSICLFGSENWISSHGKSRRHRPLSLWQLQLAWHGPPHSEETTLELRQPSPEICCLTWSHFGPESTLKSGIKRYQKCPNRRFSYHVAFYGHCLDLPGSSSWSSQWSTTALDCHFQGPTLGPPRHFLTRCIADLTDISRAKYGRRKQQKSSTFS